jgi:transposase
LTLAARRVLAVVAPVDMRLGADGLSLKLQALGVDPFDGSAYVFANQRANRLKVLAWDGNGVWLCQRRLHRGHFTWPGPGDRLLALTPAQWEWLVSGADWQRLDAALPAGARL